MYQLVGQASAIFCGVAGAHNANDVRSIQVGATFEIEKHRSILAFPKPLGVTLVREKEAGEIVLIYKV